MSSPLLGFNNNVRHRGRIFHVQTEDSGIKRPHIITHLFTDGGRIVNSARTDYSEHLEREDLIPTVRRLMKEQHKAMFMALRDGQLDEVIERICGPLPEAPRTERREGPAPSARPSRRPSRPPTLSGVPRPETSGISQDEAGRAAEPAPRRAAPTLPNIQREELEGDAGAAQQPSPGGGAPPPTAPAGAPPKRGAGKGASAPASARYAASRPAAIFSGTPDDGSIFGPTSISEQSLDEVILSYLAEDLEGTAED